MEEGQGRVGAQREIGFGVVDILGEGVGGYEDLVVENTAGFGFACCSGGEDEGGEVGGGGFCWG